MLNNLFKIQSNLIHSVLDRNYLLAFLAICLFALASCSKESIDTTTNTDDDPIVTVVNCDGFDILLIEDDGDLVLEVIAGTGPYAYAWSTEETTATITPSEDGVYSVIVTDAEGCTTSEEIVFGPSVIGCETSDLELVSDNNGVSIDVEVMGGSAPYEYNWSTGETTFSIIPAESGTYSVTVADANGCTISEEFIFEMSVDPCDGFDASIVHDGVGQLTVDVNGGTAGYFFEWSTGDNSNQITVATDGVYSLTLTDALGCVVIDQISVSLNPGSCDNTLTLTANDTMTPLMFSAESEAYLWKEDCPEIGPSLINDHHYLVVDVTWDNWGTGLDYNFYSVSDGLPGLTFGSNGAPQVGDVLIPYFVGEDLFREDVNPLGVAYVFDDIQITITETSSEMGGNIGGTVSGTIVDQNDPDNTSTVTGSFCVPIVFVCE